jgi:hypothetical protein
MSDIDNIFAFAAQQQTEMYNRIAAYKEKQAAHELLTAQVAHESAQLAQQHTKQMLRPSIMMRPHLSRDGDDWVASHGECQGRGPSPELAYQDFDAVYMGKKSE